jgi:4-hydroxythreonine-4-phosphate dehydrogenase
MRKPIIAITMGDASGIGPELIVKVLSNPDVYGYCRPFVIGDPAVLKKASRAVGHNLDIKVIMDPSEAGFAFSRLDVFCPEGLRLPQTQWGKLDIAAGRAAAQCLASAIEMATAKKADGVVSAPLNKEAFHLAGYDYLDELEYLGRLTNSSDLCVIGAMEPFWTVAATLHIPFRQIADNIKKDRVLSYIRLMEKTLKGVGVENPRIAVAALNVHGGEGGLFGREEIDEIGPAIIEAQNLNISASGPFAADSVFVIAMDEGYDAVVCMYHDQANIARKILGRKKGASLFMGLPVPFATTAHGTAFDIAGKGIADPGSLQDALKYAAMLAGH